MIDTKLQQNTKPYSIRDLRFFRGFLFGALFSVLIFTTEVLVISVVIKLIFGFAFRHVVINTFIFLTLLYVVGVFIFIGHVFISNRWQEIN